MSNQRMFMADGDPLLGMGDLELLAWTAYNMVRAGVSDASILEMFQKVFSIDDLCEVAWVNLREIFAGRPGYRAIALEFYDGLIEDGKADVNVFVSKGLCLLERAGAFGDVVQDLEASLKLFNEAVSINPEHGYALFFRGEVLDNLGRPIEAILCYSEAYKKNPKLKSAAYACARLLEKNDWLDTAVTLLGEVYKSDPTDADALLNYGWALVRAGAPGKAVQVYDEYLAGDPNNLLVLVNKGDAYRGMGNIKSAYGSYKPALEQKPDDPRIWRRVSFCLDEMRCHAKADECRDLAFRLESENMRLQALKEKFSKASRNT